MTSIVQNKVIHTAVSAPGAGKTQALISQISSLLSAGHSIVIALPTLNLTDSFVDRLPAGMSYCAINSNTCDHVGSELVTALKRKTSHLIITTHQSIFAVGADMLEGCGVLQGSCRVSRVFKLLFSLPAAPSLG